MMFLNMVLEMSGFVRPYGLRSSSDEVGISVANARLARVSMIRFTQSICTAFRGLSSIAQAPTNATITATTFTVS